MSRGTADGNKKTLFLDDGGGEGLSKYVRVDPGARNNLTLRPPAAERVRGTKLGGGERRGRCKAGGRGNAKVGGWMGDVGVGFHSGARCGARYSSRKASRQTVHSGNIKILRPPCRR